MSQAKELTLWQVLKQIFKPPTLDELRRVFASGTPTGIYWGRSSDPDPTAVKQAKSGHRT